MRPPRLNLKTAPTALKKLGRVNTWTFSTESAIRRHHHCARFSWKDGHRKPASSKEFTVVPALGELELRVALPAVTTVGTLCCSIAFSGDYHTVPAAVLRSIERTVRDGDRILC